MGWLKTAILSVVSRKITALERKHQASYHFLFMKPSGAQLQVLKEYIEAGRIKPVIDKVYRLEDTAQAFRYLEGGSAKGKVIVKMD